MNSNRSYVSGASELHLKRLLSLALPSDSQVPSFQAGDPDNLRSHFSEMDLTVVPDAKGLDLVYNGASLEDLVRIKDAAKGLLGTVTDPNRRKSALLLYHAAIASALVHHRRNISSHPIAERLAFYVDLGSLYRGDPLGALFSSAADAISELTA